MRETDDNMPVGQAEIADIEATLPTELNLSSFAPNSINCLTPTVSPFSMFDFAKKERKRRRIIGNQDNTLDGLVAKKAEKDPNAKRYQTESEAIEIPNDEEEIKRLESDPDVNTRMCSLCGYKGKWVSEMVRHKRVHTNERPFKCRFCNRTSKWKADLIRHVAKTHGIRVVSKYSRSKTYEAQNGDTVVVQPKKDENNHKLSHSFPSPQKHSLPPLNLHLNSPASTYYKCQHCSFENDSIDTIVAHLNATHNLSAFECHQCQQKFSDVNLISAHFLAKTCLTSLMRLNFATVNTPSKNNGLLTVATSTTVSSPFIHTATTDMDSASTSGVSSCASSHDFEQKNLSSPLKCSDCAYRTENAEKLSQHKVGHDTPKGPFCYQCLFCSWNSKKKSAMERHLMVHTDNPQQFMPQIERNFLAVPVPQLEQSSLLANLAQNNLAQNNLAAQLLSNGGASAPQLYGQPLQAPVFNAAAFGLLSALCNVQQQQQQRRQECGQPQQAAPLIGAIPTAGGLNLGAFKEFTPNPLMFNLCSLLGSMSQSSQMPEPSQPNTSTTTSLENFTASSFDH